MPGPREVVRTGWPGWPQVGLAAAAIKQDRPGIDRVDGQHPVASPLSCARRSRTACSEGAEIACKISRPSPPRGPPRRMNPSSTRASMKRACSSQPSCSCRSRDQFHGPPPSSRTAKTPKKPTAAHASRRTGRVTAESRLLLGRRHGCGRGAVALAVREAEAEVRSLAP